MAELPSLHVGLVLDSATFVQGIGRVNRELRGIHGTINTLGTGLKAVSAAFGGFIGAMSVGQLVRVGRAALDTAGGLKEIAQQAGVTTRELQILQLAGVQSGSSIEEIATSLAQFGRRVGEAATGSGALADTLEELNIAIKDSAGNTRSSYEILGDLAEAVQNASSEQEKLRIATDALGRSGAKLLPILNEGREGLEKFASIADKAGLILGKNFIDAADRAADAIATLEFAVQRGFQIGFVEAFADAVSGSAENLRTAAAAGEAFGTAVGTALATVLDLAQRLEPAFNVLSKLTIGFEARAKTLMTIFEAVGLATASTASASESLTDINQKLSAALAERNRLLDQISRVPIKSSADTFRVEGLNQRIAELEKLQAEALSLSETFEPLTLNIHKAEDATTSFTPKLKPLATELRSAAAAAEDFTETMRFDVEGDRRLTQLNSMHANAKRITEEQERLISEAAAPREALRDTQALSDEMAGVWQGLGQSIQSTFADTYEDIFTGGLDSFGDLADAIKDIFIRLAAEIAALMTAKALFGGLSGGLGGLSSALGVGGGVAGPMGTGMTTPGGQFIPAIGGGGLLQSLGFGPGGFAAPGALGLGGSLAAGGLGALSGSLIGGLFGGQGKIGGGIGGGLGAFAGGLTPLGPLGAVAGGLLGSLGGGLLGSLFGGGGGSRNTARIGGSALGAGTGTGLAATFASDLDKQIEEMLTTLQEGIANQVLTTTESIKVVFDKKKGLSEADMSRIAASRLGPVSTALGISAAAVTTGTAEQQQAQFQEALGAQQAIEDLRGTLAPFGTAISNLNEDFATVTEAAVEYGISLEGVAQAQQLALDALARQHRSQFNQVALMVGAIRPVDAALNDLQIRMEEAATAAAATGVPLDNLAATHQRMKEEIIAQFTAQAPLVEVQQQSASAIAEENRQRRLQIHAYRELAGIYSPLNRALADLQVQFEGAWAEAVRLGEATHTLATAHTRAIVATVNAQRLEVHALREQIGIYTPLERALADLQVQFENAWHEADRLGQSTRNLTRQHEAARDAVIRQHQAQLDAMALSITNPFEDLLAPLRELGIELNRSLMNPLEQFEASAQHFRDTLARAQAGSVEAIQELDDAGRAFMQTAEAVGASPGRAAASREVQAGLHSVMGEISTAQGRAQAGIEGAIWGANQRVVDTLGELVTESRLTRQELRRLQRQLD